MLSARTRHFSSLTDGSPDTLVAAQALLLLKAAWDLGINTIDTANMYSNGDAERMIAAFIDKVCIAPMHVRFRKSKN